MSGLFLARLLFLLALVVWGGAFLWSARSEERSRGRSREETE